MTAIAVAPDGLSVYVASGFNGVGGVAAFARDAATGALTQLPGGDGCVNESDTSCTVDAAVSNAHGVAVSPDGRFVYVASFDGALVSLTRDKSGALTPIAAPDGCLADDHLPHLPCGDGSGLWQLNGLVASPDGLNVYGSSADAGIAGFRRTPAIAVDPPAPPQEPEPPAPPVTPPVVTPAAPPIRVIVEAPHAEDEPVVEQVKLTIANQTGYAGFRSGRLRVIVRCTGPCSGSVSAYAKSKGKLTRLAPAKRVKLKRKGSKMVNFRVTGKNLKLLRKTGTTLLFKARAS
jgi:hypothetical protein